MWKVTMQDRINTLRARLDNIPSPSQRLQSRIDSVPYHTTETQTRDLTNELPPPYSRYTAEASTQTVIGNTDNSSLANTQPSSTSNTAMQQPTRVICRNPIRVNTLEHEHSTVSRRIPLRLNFESRPAFYPRLKLLIESRVDRAKLLRSVLAFIMSSTFYAEPNINDRDTLNMYRWSKTTYTETIAGPLKYLAWDVFETTSDLCILIRHLEQGLKGNRWFNARREHKDLLIQLVLKPAKELNLPIDYTLEIMGTFIPDIPPNNRRRNTYYTLVDHCKVAGYCLEDYADTIASHAALITALKLGHEQQTALEDAIAEYVRIKDKNLKITLKTSEALKRTILDVAKSRPDETCCWPVSRSYMDLAQIFGNSESDWKGVLDKQRKPKNTVYWRTEVYVLEQ